MSPAEPKPYVVRLDEVVVEEHASHLDALAAARILKDAIPEQLVTVWDVTAGEAVIIES
jgi:hypothetical protein